MPVPAVIVWQLPGRRAQYLSTAIVSFDGGGLDALSLALGLPRPVWPPDVVRCAAREGARVACVAARRAGG